MKVYVVCDLYEYDASGECVPWDSIHATEESAEKEAARLGERHREWWGRPWPYQVTEVEVKDD